MIRSLCLAVMFISLAGCTSTSRRGPNGNGTHVPRPTPLSIDLGEKTVIVEVADTIDSRWTGLGGRTSLKPDHGMLFMYLEARPRRFWMRGCRMGLDIAYVDADRVAFQIGSFDAPPPGTPDEDLVSFESEGDALFVLEMEKGWFASHGIGPGTRLSFSTALDSRAASVKE